MSIHPAGEVSGAPAGGKPAVVASDRVIHGQALSLPAEYSRAICLRVSGGAIFTRDSPACA